MIEILDSETFYYHSEDSHQGRHSIIRTLMPGYPLTEPGQYVWTVREGIDYLWEADTNGLRWIEWSCDNRPHRIPVRWEEIEREELLAIETNRQEFFVGDIAVLGLGSEIEVTPRRVYEHEHYDTWIVDLTLPMEGFDTCRFQVYGSRRDWIMKRAILDSPMLIALRKSKFEDADYGHFG